MPFDLTAIFDAASKFAVTLDQHPLGAVTLIVLAVATAAVAIVWKLA